jgi:flagellar biogenesis protein FliO
LACLAAALLWSPIAAATTPVVTQTSVVEDDLMSVVRLGVSANPSSVKTDVDCDPQAVRIRFKGLVTHIEGDLQELAIPETSPFSAIRIVPRFSAEKGSSTVVQFIPRDKVSAVCSRFQAVVSNDGVTAIYRLTEKDRARRSKLISKDGTETKAPKGTDKPLQELTAPLAPAPENAAQAKTQAADSTKPPVAEDASSPPASTTDQPLFGKEKKAGAEKAATATSERAALTGGKGPSPFLAALGCALAGLIALAAYFLKRRGHKSSGLDLDSIEILSSKRLGARQSLVLAAVGGKRFLLAVSEKTVSTLGEVRDEDAVADHPTLSGMAELNPPRPATVPMASELGSHKGKAPNLEGLPERDPRELLRQLLGNNSAPEPVFERELRSAMGNTTAPEPARPSHNLSESSSDGISSNAAGLIAMARMRASMRRRPSGPTAQA